MDWLRATWQTTVTKNTLRFLFIRSSLSRFALGTNFVASGLKDSSGLLRFCCCNKTNHLHFYFVLVMTENLSTQRLPMNNIFSTPNRPFDFIIIVCDYLWNPLIFPMYMVNTCRICQSFAQNYLRYIFYSCNTTNATRTTQNMPQRV